MYYVAHRTSLAVGKLNDLHILANLENCVQKIYEFFANLPRKSLNKFSCLATLLGTKGLKLVKNVKMRWMGILPCVLRVQTEYKPLILKMSEDAPIVGARKRIFFGLLNIKNLLSLPFLMPMLRFVNYLLKFS